MHCVCFFFVFFLFCFFVVVFFFFFCFFFFFFFFLLCCFFLSVFYVSVCLYSFLFHLFNLMEKPIGHFEFMGIDKLHLSNICEIFAIVLGYKTGNFIIKGPQFLTLGLVISLTSSFSAGRSKGGSADTGVFFFYVFFLFFFFVFCFFFFVHRLNITNVSF